MNVLRLTLFQLKISKKTIIGWCIALFGFMFLYMILFSSMQDMAQVKFEVMPEELLQFVGMEDFASLANYISYFGMIYNLILIAMSIFLATFSAGILAKEEHDKTIEFLYAQEVTRTEIYLSKMLCAMVAATLVMISVMVSAIICGFANGGETFVLMDVMQIVKMTSITPIFFLFIGISASGLTTKISGSTIGSMAVLSSYLLGYLSALLGDDYEWLSYLSPFERINPQAALALEPNTVITIFVYFFIALALFALSGFVYKKRDFNL